MQLTFIDKEMLRTAIASNTDASEQDAAQIINTVLLKQRKRHDDDCECLCHQWRDDDDDYH